ncbi:MAG: fructose-1,6-bisphosphate aldolase, class II [Deltaproteobacteria bacterium]|nr:MAG: fructose-1,6-bisphosphate aldolase, class II [Deltaproteobacteria bacterium]
MAVDYRDLGLVNTKEMFEKALAGGYAIPAYNFNNMEQLQAIVNACVETSSPVILQVSSGARNYANEIMLRHMAAGAVEMARAKGSNIPITLHLDHGANFELCVSCIEAGFSSVMIDGSAHSFEDNIALTKKVVEYARPRGVTVEGELGVLAGIEDEVSHETSSYTKPEEVEEFVERAGCDSLAISIGTSHGAYKFKVKSQVEVPPLRFDILEEIEKRLPGFPIVLHGASSVVPAFVDMINQYGGDLEGAVGVPEEQLRRAAKSAVCKINIDSDGRLAMTAIVRKFIAENPKEFDPRKYLGAARDALTELLKHKNENVVGSAGRA